MGEFRTCMRSFLQRRKVCNESCVVSNLTWHFHFFFYFRAESRHAPLWKKLLTLCQTLYTRSLQQRSQDQLYSCHFRWRCCLPAGQSTHSSCHHTLTQPCGGSSWSPCTFTQVISPCCFWFVQHNHRNFPLYIKKKLHLKCAERKKALLSLTVKVDSTQTTNFKGLRKKSVFVIAGFFCWICSQKKWDCNIKVMSSSCLLCVFWQNECAATRLVFYEQKGMVHFTAKASLGLLSGSSSSCSLKWLFFLESQRAFNFWSDLKYFCFWF